MENFFNIFTKKLIHILDPDNKCTELEYLQMYYGIQTLTYNIIVTSLILILSYFLKCFFETCLLFATFGTLRLIAGGLHFNSIFKCISVTTLIMLGGGKYIAITDTDTLLCIATIKKVKTTYAIYKIMLVNNTRGGDPACSVTIIFITKINIQRIRSAPSIIKILGDNGKKYFLFISTTFLDVKRHTT